MNWATSNKKCLIIAHRGDTKAGVENTLPAIASALRLGIDGIEVDLQLTRDGEVVVYHDDDLRRLAGINKTLQDLTLAETRTISLHGAGIPTLAELLDLVRDKVLLNLELKTVGYFKNTLEQKVIQGLEKFNLKDSILISSFYPQALWRMKKLAPDIQRGYLFDKYPTLHRWVIPYTDPTFVNAPLACTTPKFVESVHAAGRRFFVWTVNSENDIKRCIDAFVDGIITDEPRMALNILNLFKLLK